MFPIVSLMQGASRPQISFEDKERPNCGEIPWINLVNSMVEIQLYWMRL